MSDFTKQTEEHEYFICDCIYHKKGYILCLICEKKINEDNEKDDRYFKVKRRTKPYKKTYKI